MKNNSATPHDLLWYGPLLEGEIHTDEISFLGIKNQQATDGWSKVKLLVDTGSNISGIDARVVQQLNLRQYQVPVHVDGVGGIHQVNRYRCILFMNIFGTKGLPLDVIAGDFSQSPYDGVIGRDVLQYCRFTFDGPGNLFKLEAIDF